MVQTMGKGLYSMSTVVQGEKLGQFLDTEMPSMDDLKVPHAYTVSAALVWMLVNNKSHSTMLYPSHDLEMHVFTLHYTLYMYKEASV